MEYLDRVGLVDDSLGLLKAEHKNYVTAASFHQISDYSSAKAHYMAGMTDSESYFIGLSRLRTVSLNLSLPTTPGLRDHILAVRSTSAIAVAVLPCLTSPASHTELPSSLSYLHIPSFLLLALRHDLHLGQKVLQQRNSPAEAHDFIRASNVIPLKSLDKQMLMSSSFTWRLTNLGELAGRPESESKVHDVLIKNRIVLARLLSKSGAFRQSLKFWARSTPSPEFRPFVVTERNFPIVLAFRDAATTRVKLDCMILMQRFEDAHVMLTRGLPALEGRLWLQFVVHFMRLWPSRVATEITFRRILSSASTITPKKIDFWIALILNLLRIDPSLSMHLSDGFLVSEEWKLLWLRWLPILFTICTKIPTQFIQSIYRSNPVKFKLTIRQVMLVRMHLADLNITDIQNATSDRTSPGAEAAFSWVEKCSSESSHLTISVMAYRYFVQCLVGNRRPLADEFAGRIPTDMKQLEAFCHENPPFFRTGLTTLECRTLVGLYFPTRDSRILAMSLDAPGTREAVLSVVTHRGDIRSFPIISSMIYRLTIRENIFSSCVARMIETNQAARCRPRPLTSVECYSIDGNLTIVVSPAHVQGLYEIAQPINIPQVFALAAARSFTDYSPKSAMEAQIRDIPTDLLHRCLVQRSEASLVDFLVTRNTFACGLACFSYLYAVFRAPHTSTPSMFIDDRHRLYLPGFLTRIAKPAKGPPEFGISPMPLTDQVKGACPPFVLQGSAATTWNITATALFEKRESLRIFLTALIPESHSSKLIRASLERVKHMAPQTAVGNPGYDSSFGFDAFEHIVATANQSFHAQACYIAWI
jgi:hypothetical protein